MLGASPLPGSCVSWSPTRGVFALPSAPTTHLGGELWLDTSVGDMNRCVLGLSCSTGGDGTSLACAGAQCLAPTCDDGVKNATETYLDCGGANRPGCQNNQLCSSTADCHRTVPRSGYAHTVDGQFTGWTIETRPSAYESDDVPPAEGQYTKACFDLSATTRFMLSDWSFNAAASIDPSRSNLFVLHAGGGAARWQVKARANGAVQVFEDGVLIPSNTTGVASGCGFTASRSRSSARSPRAAVWSSPRTRTCLAASRRPHGGRGRHGRRGPRRRPRMDAGHHQLRRSERDGAPLLGWRRARAPIRSTPLAPVTGDPGVVSRASNPITERGNLPGPLDTNDGAHTTPSIAGTPYSALPARVATNTLLALRGHHLRATGGTVDFATATGTVNATATSRDLTVLRTPSRTRPSSSRCRRAGRGRRPAPRRRARSPPPPTA